MPSAFPLLSSAFDRELVLEFFWKFSVVEFALKREGYLKSDRHDGARPDWERFADDIEGLFCDIAIERLPDAMNRLRELSPKRQVVRERVLAWEPVDRGTQESETAYTLRLLRTARNNLFHGGKYSHGDVAEVARDHEILRAGITILDACCEVHAGVRTWIEEAAGAS